MSFQMTSLFLQPPVEEGVLRKGRHFLSLMDFQTEVCCLEELVSDNFGHERPESALKTSCNDKLLGSFMNFRSSPMCSSAR